MHTPRHLLRLIFATSSFALAIALIVAAFRRQFNEVPEFLPVAAVALLLTVPLCSLFFRRKRMLIQEVRLIVFVWSFTKTLLVSYLVLALLVGSTFFVVFLLAGMKLSEAGVISAFSGVWLAVWLCPVAASWSTWKRLRVSTENDG